MNIDIRNAFWCIHKNKDQSLINYTAKKPRKHRKEMPSDTLP